MVLLWRHLYVLSELLVGARHQVCYCCLDQYVHELAYMAILRFRSHVGIKVNVLPNPEAFFIL